MLCLTLQRSGAMEPTNRSFKGVWIPQEIYLAQDLNWTDKIILIEIDSLDNNEHCFASNDYFAEFLNISTVSVSKSINKLIKMGYITAISFDGRHRTLKSNLKGALNQTLKQTEREIKPCIKEKFKDNNTSINKKEIYKEKFEEFWKEYPKQRAGKKENALKSYCKAVDKIEPDRLLEIVKIYANSDDVKRGYAKGCAAWLNDERYNDAIYQEELDKPYFLTRAGVKVYY